MFGGYDTEWLAKSSTYVLPLETMGRDQSNQRTLQRRPFLKAGLASLLGGVGLFSSAVAAQPSFDGWMDDVDNYDGIVDERGSDDISVVVGAEGNNGNFAFEPPAVRIDPGTTIIWEWNGLGGAHNVNAMEGGDFESDLTEQEGFTFSHTFEETGIVKYQCDPHAGLGMKGVVIVGDQEIGTEAPAPTGPEGESAERPLPGDDIGAILIGVILGTAGLAAFAVLANEVYRSIKSAATTTAATDTSADVGGAEHEAAEAGIVREIGHEEFEPIGTASLIALYFVILLIMWIFVYFIEFLGRDIVIIG